eukprot:CAMPEP_0119323676 /NCGR_PEP_ID=MMETSP1333-20130426/61257_1 /TAXON_ID=418940 /ORGANISM="Scyphosphaera apsteinii, Strain RCC1455" /LENGTH=45 /DNA_ID= /DNA_START= /DNA_END= /DNA_ORIENTATION=
MNAVQIEDEDCSTKMCDIPEHKSPKEASQKKIILASECVFTVSQK